MMLYAGGPVGRLISQSRMPGRLARQVVNEQLSDGNLILGNWGCP